MDPSILIPIVGTVALGGIASHIMSNRRVRRAQRQFAANHVRAMTSLADAAVEILCVDHGMDVPDAQKLLLEEAQRRNPHLVGVPAGANDPAFLARARKMIEDKRAAKKAAKDATNDVSK
jgi:hypothetical protein